MVNIIVELVREYSLISIMILSFLITLALTLVYKKFSHQEGIKNAKERTKEIQEKLKTEKDQTKIIQLQKEMLELSMEQMKHGMKPMLITFLPLIAIFAGLRILYAGTPNIFSYNVKIPLLCNILPGLCDGAGWFVCYVLFSFIFSLILRKLLKVH